MCNMIFELVKIHFKKTENDINMHSFLAKMIVA